MTNYAEEQDDEDEIETFVTESDFCQKVSRLLSGDIKVSVSHDQYVSLAGAKGKKIILNFNEIRKHSPENDEFVTKFKGLNYHELGHVLFTNVDLKKHVYENSLRIPELDGMDRNRRTKVRDALNILEDSRMENLMSATYPNASKYFLYIVSQFILKRQERAIDTRLSPQDKKAKMEDEVFNSWILTYGRRFVRRSLVGQFEQKVAGIGRFKKQDIQVIKDLFDIYNITHDRVKQIQLSVQLAEVLDKISPVFPQMSMPYSGTDSAKNNQRQRQATQQIAEAIMHDDEKKEQARAQGKMGKNKASAGQGFGNIEDELKEMNEQLRKSLEVNKSKVEKEVAQDIQALYGDNGGSFAGRSELEVRVEDNPFRPSAHHQIVSRRIRRLLSTLRNGLEARYIKGMRTGRLDVRQIMTTQGKSPKVFKKYQPSRLGRSKMAVAILLDSSGSMHGGQFNMVMESAWALDKALAEGGDKTMVIEYSDTHKVLKGFYGRQGNWRRHFHSGTQPLSALKTAQSHLRKIKQIENISNLVCFIMTDGSWGYAEECQKVIKQMNKQGVHTVLIKPKGGWRGDSHGTKEEYVIDQMEQMEDVMRKVIVKIQREVQQHGRVY